MTITTLTSTGTATRARRARNWPEIAGLTYVGAWVLGLVAFGFGPAADASDADIARYLADHRTMSTIQSLLIHGVAAVALLGVMIAVRSNGRLNRWAWRAALVAVGVSLVQCVLDVHRSALATGSTIADLTHIINRIDGIKMIALAVMIAASIRVFRSTAMIGTKMTLTGTVAVAALVVSGIAYVTATTALLATAALSLILLLVWVGYTGAVAGRDL
jgi:hypothetical protein